MTLLELGYVGWGWGKMMSLALVVLNLRSPWALHVGASAQLVAGDGDWRDGGWYGILDGWGATTALGSTACWGRGENRAWPGSQVLRKDSLK